MSLPVDLGETQDRSGKKKKTQQKQNLISKKDGVHKVLLLMKEIRDVQSGSSCAVHKHGGKETDTSSKQSGKKGKV